MRVKCVVAEGVNRIVVRQCEQRELQEEELLVETIYSAISPGTEVRCVAGKEANAGKFPMITGYSLVGKVLRGPSRIRAGDLVFLNGADAGPEGISLSWGGHISPAIGLASKAVKLPPSVDLKAASAISMLAVAMHGACRAMPRLGDDALVVGQGLIGLFAAVFLKMAGCRVAVCDPMTERLEVARRLGIGHRVQPQHGWHDLLRRDFPEGVDILMDATSSPKVISANLPLLREKSWTNPYAPSPRLVLLASYPGEIAIEYQNTLFNKETEIVTCRTYLPHERERVIRLLATGALDLSPILGDALPVDQAPEAFRRLREEPQRQITYILDWQETV